MFDKNSEPAKYTVKKVSIVLTIIVFVALLFNASGLVKWAKDMPIGSKRDLALGATQPIASATQAVGLDKPKEVFQKNFRDIAGVKVDAGFVNAKSDSIQNSVLDSKNISGRDNTENRKNDGPIVFSKSRKLSLLMIGDSMMGPGFGYMLYKKLETDSLITPDRYFKHSSGLSRPDYFNWFAQIQQLYQAKKYDAVVVMMGTNDAQGFENAGKVHPYGSEGWITVYRERVGAFLDAMLAKSEKVFWVGMPPMREPGFDGRMRMLTSIVSEEIGKRKNAVFISTVKLLGDASGAYAAFLPYNGVATSMRENDGIHFTNPGGDIVAMSVVESLKKNFTFK